MGNEMKNWQNVVVNTSSTLEQAIQVMEAGALRIVLVVDDQNKLRGTVTDGDLRRALIKQVNLQSSVDSVMCAKPLVVDKTIAREDVIRLLERNKLLHMPVVNDDDELVGLHTIDDFYTSSKYDNIVFLMAGGFGTRLRPLTNSCPKPMLKIGDKPILELILESFIKSGFHRFYISLHYLPEMIKSYFGDGSKWGVSIEYVNEDKPLGTAGALGLLPQEKIDAPVFVMNGDLLTDVDFVSMREFHLEHDSVATMGVREYEHQVPYGVIEMDGSRISSVVEKPTQKFFVNAGIYVLSETLVKSIKKGQYLDMPDLLAEQISDDKQVSSFPIREYWLDIGRMNDFERAQEEFDERFN